MTDKNDGTHDANDAAPSASAVSKAKPKDPAPSQPVTEADLEKVKEQMSGFERSTLRWTAASFFIILATGVFIGLQWNEMRVGGSDTHTLAQQAVADQRPWISLKFVSTQSQVEGVRVTENQPLVLPVQIINSGKSPARNVIAKIFVEIVKNGDSPKLDLAKVPPSGITSGVLFPNDLGDKGVAIRMNSENQFDPVSPTEFQAITSRQAYIAVYGRIDYLDVFNIPRWTKFCGWTTGTPGYYSALACSAYNSVDTN